MPSVETPFARSCACHRQLRRRQEVSCLFSTLFCSTRPLHSSTTRVCLQQRRSAATSWRSGRTPSSSSPTFRHPTQNLLSPFGSVLHGASRGPQATFAEPLDVWLAVLADSVPFYKDCLLVCPSTTTQAQVRHVWDRCRAHMPTAHVGTLRPRSVQHVHKKAPASTPHGKQQQSVNGAASLSSSSSSSPAPFSSSTALSAPAPSPPALRSPLEDVPPASLDLVLFAQNVFAHEMLFDAPWHLSLAHRALRPHGVVAILGHVADADVVAPEWATASCAECLGDMHEEAQADLEMAGWDAVRRLPSSPAQKRRLQHAVEVQETLRTAHSDVFFPFPSIRRRWFTSEYAMHPSQLAASYRAAPVYQALYSPAGSLWRSEAHHALQQQQQRERKDGGDDGGVFVDLTVPEVGSAVDVVQGQSDSLAAWSPAGVQRRRGAVDPLDALQSILEAHTVGQVDGAGRVRPPVEPPLRVRMRHFVVTCSTRSMNATLEGPPPPPRLPGRQGNRVRSLPSSQSGGLPPQFLS